MKKTSDTRSKSDRDILEHFGKNLKSIREQKQFSQEELAYEAGFSRSYYTEVETGKRNISLLNITKILLALESDANELIKLNELKKLIR